MKRWAGALMALAKFCLLVVSVAAAGAAQAAPIYTITELGSLSRSVGGSLVGGPRAINDRGQLTGLTEDGGGASRAFLYDNGVLTLLGTLGGTQSQGDDINNSGHIVGHSTTVDGKTHAFLFDGTTMHDLEPLGDRNSNALGINEHGQVTGVSQQDGARPRAFLHDGSAITQLGTLGGDEISIGEAINASGYITGIANNSSEQNRAFLYDGTTMHDLGTLGGTTSVGRDINDNGNVTGASRTGVGLQQHAYFYDGMAMQDIGTLGGVFSSGSGINNRDEIVGESRTASDTFRAFYWTAADGILDLNALIDMNDPLFGNIVLIDAIDINNNGWIIALGQDGEETRSYLLVPLASNIAEPASLALFGLGVSALGLFRRKRFAEVGQLSVFRQYG